MLTSSPNTLFDQTSIFALSTTNSILAFVVWFLTAIALCRVFTKGGNPG
ncbi:hypothetical protein [Microbacterium sp. B19]|nr:hypothetical protein [Microbacterium sp. B19]